MHHRAEFRADQSSRCSEMTIFVFFSQWRPSTMHLRVVIRVLYAFWAVKGRAMKNDPCTSNIGFTGMLVRVFQEESLDGWKIVRNIDGQDKPEFVMTQIMLEPMMKFKVQLRTFICFNFCAFSRTHVTLQLVR